MMRALYGRVDQFLKELLLCCRNCRRLLRQRGQKDQQQEKKDDRDRVSHRGERPRNRSYQVFTG
jgi:hypothetical protein